MSSVRFYLSMCIGLVILLQLVLIFNGFEDSLSSLSLSSLSLSASSSSSSAFPSLQHQRTLNTLIDAGYAKSPSSSSSSSSSSAPFTSKIICTHPEAACLIENLYYIDKEFHLFLAGVSDTKDLLFQLGVYEGTVWFQVHDTAIPPSYLLSPRVEKVAGIFTLTKQSLFDVIFIGAAYWLNILGNHLFSEKEFVLFLHESIPLKGHHLEALLPAFNVHNLEHFGNLIFSRAVVGIPDGFTYSSLGSNPTGSLDSTSLRARALKQFTSLIREDIADSLMEKVMQTQEPLRERRDPVQGDSEQNQEQEQEREDIFSNNPLKRKFILISGDSQAQITNAVEIALAFKEGRPGDDQKIKVLQVDDPLNVYEEVFVNLQFDVHVRIHRHNMAGLLLMRPETTLIEVVPEGILIEPHVSCIAATLGIQYFIFDSAGARMAGSLLRSPSPKIAEHPAIRLKFNQSLGSDFNYEVNIAQMVRALRFVTNGKPKRFLTMMPWEQLNNQIIEFKASCAVSAILNRTLILPYLGWRKTSSWDFNFNIQDFEWKPFEYYFDQFSLESLPCHAISMEEYREFYQDYPGIMLFNPVAKATSSQQLKDYYCQQLGFPCVLEPIDIGRQQQITRSEVEATLKFNGVALFAGAMFWFYDFGRYQPYPLTEYVNYMDDPIYKQIVGSLRLSPKIEKIMDQMVARFPEGRYNAIHVRRGDYYNKCSKIQEKELQDRCFPSAQAIEQKVKVHFDPNIPLYISTNIASDKSEFLPLEKEFKVSYINELLGSEMSNLDANELALFDQGLCSRAEHFIGNFYSSFSRTIVEFREFEGKSFDFW